MERRAESWWMRDHTMGAPIATNAPTTSRTNPGMTRRVAAARRRWFMFASVADRPATPRTQREHTCGRDDHAERGDGGDPTRLAVQTGRLPTGPGRNSAGRRAETVDGLDDDAQRLVRGRTDGVDDGL